MACSKCGSVFGHMDNCPRHDPAVNGGHCHECGCIFGHLSFCSRYGNYSGQFDRQNWWARLSEIERTNYTNRKKSESKAYRKAVGGESVPAWRCDIHGLHLGDYFCPACKDKKGV